MTSRIFSRLQQVSDLLKNQLSWTSWNYGPGSKLFSTCNNPPRSCHKRPIMEEQGKLFEKEGVRVAIEGCGHGTLNAIYAAVSKACEARSWDGVDLLIICGDFQSTRNAHDITVMSVPPKYRVMGDFYEYYSGERQAPYLTVFVAGNHEASSYLWELYYGGWVAPHIYYMGASNVLRLGPLRIAGMSGIWKGFDYRKPHIERLPFNEGDIKSFYHVRECDVRKLLQIRDQVDVGISHDWPRGIEKHGDVQSLYRLRPMWKQESLDGSLGSVAAEYVMDRLRPAYWFSAHMHWQYAALKKYPAPTEAVPEAEAAQAVGEAIALTSTEPLAANPDEIDLDMDDDDDEGPAVAPTNDASQEPTAPAEPKTIVVTEELRAQLPASFSMPKVQAHKGPPGQPVPPTITNTDVRFLALNKCEPGRHFLQVCELNPVDPSDLAKHPSKPNGTSTTSSPRYKLQYDPEWLAITRAFAADLTIGDREARVPEDEGEAHYRLLIEAERAWVEENVVKTGSLDVPDNFAITAPPHPKGEKPDLHSGVQPLEYTNNQTKAFCEMLRIPNLWHASEEERAERRERGPPPEQQSANGRGFRGGGHGDFGGGRGGGGRGGRGGGRVRGGGRGRGRGRGRGGRW